MVQTKGTRMATATCFQHKETSLWHSEVLCEGREVSLQGP